MMKPYCPDCGSSLDARRGLAEALDAPMALDLCSCPSEQGKWFLEAGHPVNIFPLLPLRRGVGEILFAAPDELVAAALEKIEVVDHKTIRITEFERFILDNANRPGSPSGRRRGIKEIEKEARPSA